MGISLHIIPIVSHTLVTMVTTVAVFSVRYVLGRKNR